MDYKQKLAMLEAELVGKGGALVKKEARSKGDGTWWIVVVVLALAGVLLLANQVDSQQRERWGLGLFGFGVGLGVGTIRRGK